MSLVYFSLGVLVGTYIAAWSVGLAVYLRDDQ